MPDCPKLFCLRGTSFHRIALFWKVALINSKVSTRFRRRVRLFYSTGNHAEGGYGIALPKTSLSVWVLRILIMTTTGYCEMIQEENSVTAISFNLMASTTSSLGVAAETYQKRTKTWETMTYPLKCLWPRPLSILPTVRSCPRVKYKNNSNRAPELCLEVMGSNPVGDDDFISFVHNRDITNISPSSPWQHAFPRND